MKNYEGVFIVNPDLPHDVSKGIVTGLQDLVTKNGGRVDNVQEWGKRRLAFKIKKKSEGHYVLLNFQLDGAETKKVEQMLRLNENVLRYLIINKEK